MAMLKEHQVKLGGRNGKGDNRRKAQVTKEVAGLRHDMCFEKDPIKKAEYKARLVELGVI